MVLAIINCKDVNGTLSHQLSTACLQKHSYVCQLFAMTKISISSFNYYMHVVVCNHTSIHHYKSMFFAVTTMHTNKTLALSAILVSISFLAKI